MRLSSPNKCRWMYRPTICSMFASVFSDPFVLKKPKFPTAACSTSSLAATELPSCVRVNAIRQLNARMFCMATNRFPLSSTSSTCTTIAQMSLYIGGGQGARNFSQDSLEPCRENSQLSLKVISSSSLMSSIFPSLTTNSIRVSPSSHRNLTCIHLPTTTNSGSLFIFCLRLSAHFLFRVSSISSLHIGSIVGWFFDDCEADAARADRADKFLPLIPTSFLEFI